MKLWRIAFMMLAAFSLTSCSSDDNEEFLMDQLSGTWEQRRVCAVHVYAWQAGHSG